MLDYTRVAGIKLLASDVDGVLTEGSIIYGNNGLELKIFNIKDGLALKLAGWAGLPCAWLTGRLSDAVARRAAELDVRVYQGMTDKDEGLRRMAEDFGVTVAEIAYVGDDLNDLPALRLAGLPIAVADAALPVRQAARYITQASGGCGAIREVIEFILQGQGRWDAAVETYLQRLQGLEPGQ